MISLKDIRIGMTREEVIAILGDPDAKGGTSRKYPEFSVFRYGTVELHFLPWRNGTLVFANEVSEPGNPKSILLA